MNAIAKLDLNAQLALMRTVAESALERWAGDFVDLMLVKYRENAVYSVRNIQGKRFALRVHRIDYHSSQALHSELQWMLDLARAGIPVPAVIEARGGALFVEIALPDGPNVQVDMLEWLDGEQVGSIEDLASADAGTLQKHYHAAGVLAAKLHNFSEAWDMPASFSRHAWDAEGLVGEQPFWGQFRDLPAFTQQRDLFDAACSRAGAELEELGKSKDVYGLIHGDLLPENLLQSNGSLALIDFDDSGFGWYMFELATALYFYLETPNYNTVRDSLFAGYRSARLLTEDHLAKLPLFLFLRSLTYLSWVHTRRETETAKELEAFFVFRATDLAHQYLKL